MKRLIALMAVLVLALILASCASKRLDAQMRDFEGQHIDQFIARRGLPTEVTPLSNQTKLYEWHIVRGITEANANTTGNVNVATNIQVGGKQQAQKPPALQWCNYRVLTDKNDKILSATWEGNICRATR